VEISYVLVEYPTVQVDSGASPQFPGIARAMDESKEKMVDRWKSIMIVYFSLGAKYESRQASKGPDRLKELEEWTMMNSNDDN
jgi:hypothetical protein